jgi:hypothetical protein
MAIWLTFDVFGSTCGDLLRFADAVRAAGAQPEHPLQQRSGPNRIEVVVDDKGGGHGPSSGQFPPPRFGPQVGPRQMSPQQGPGFTMSDAVGPRYTVFGGGRPQPGSGCSIEIHQNGTSYGTQVPIETVGQWRSALDTVLGAAGLDESVRGSLSQLREAFSDQMPPGYPGGS